MNRHFFIPDTQVKEGVPLCHLEAAGNYIVEKKPDVIIMAGDHADMPSLSSYDVGKKSFEGRRYKKDIEDAIVGMETLVGPIIRYNNTRRKQKMRLYKPRMVLTLGNHEERIIRATEFDAKLDGTIGIHDLQYESFGWEVYPFLVPVEIDGILYAHYFVNPLSLKKTVLGGTIDNKLQKIGQSFSMGHQQTLQYGVRYTNSGREHRGLVAGAFYQHEEDYMGPQGNHHWRGCVMKNEVRDGVYDPMMLSLDYFLREWV